jgi:dipeptidyl aminopeptidase/acylaminoacyl peptidase
MTRRALRSILLLVFYSVLLHSSSVLLLAQNSQKRAITEKDLFDFVWVADPQISPDGSRVAFVRVNVNEKKLGYDTSIWVVPTAGGEPQRLTTGPHDSAPRWSPDGRKLVFQRAAEKEGKPQPPQLALLSMAGGEPIMLTSLPKGAEGAAWSPDGKTIAFLSDTNAEDIAKEEKKKKQPAEQEHESDVRVITLAVYRDNDEGYIDEKHHTHIWTIAAPTSEEVGKPKQLTSGIFDEGEPKWSPDGSRLYFISTRIVEPYYQLPITVLYSIPAGGGPITTVAQIDGFIQDFSISPDGRSTAFVGSIVHPVASYYESHLFVADLAGRAAPANVAPQLDADVGSGILGDQHPPRGGQPSSPVWVEGGKSIIEAVTEKGVSNLMRFEPAGGRIQPFTSGDHDLMAWSATPDGSRFVVLVSTPTSVGDLFLANPGGKLTQLTRFNDKLFSQLTLTAPERIHYASFDGKTIDGWIQKPPDFDPAKKYPLILNIHGGPHTTYGYTFDHEFQWMAAKGYVVLYPNPRGSSSYGQEFGNIIQYHYPGDDYKDLMAGVDEVVKRGYIDTSKLGVTGGSGGGVLTNWTVTQTDRFAAAVSQRSIADWAGWWYTADFTLFTPNWFRGAPFQDPADFTQRSAITHIANAKTPLMLIEGEADYRTPPGPGGETMFRAYKFMKKPTVMVRFPGESHELSRSGQPWHRVERLEHIVNWFDKYLQGKDLHLYDVPSEESVKNPEEKPKTEQPPQ